MRYGVIDIGTNSCRLLIGRKMENTIARIYHTLETTRLGEGLQENQTINQSAMLRTCAALNNFKVIMQEYEVEKIKVVATSAVREAANQREFIKLVKAKCQLEVEILSAEQEALLSYMGVKKGLALANDLVVVDLGGGSTEIIQGDDFLLSLPIGAVKVHEANISAYDITQSLKPLNQVRDKWEEYPVVVVGGTATSLVAIKYGMEEYRSEQVQGEKLTRQEIADLYNLLEKMSLALRRRLPGLQAERADIITSGTLLLLLIMDTLNKTEIIVSASDLMEALISEM